VTRFFVSSLFELVSLNDWHERTLEIEKKIVLKVCGRMRVGLKMFLWVSGMNERPAGRRGPVRQKNHPPVTAPTLNSQIKNEGCRFCPSEKSRIFVQESSE